VVLTRRGRSKPFENSEPRQDGGGWLGNDEIDRRLTLSSAATGATARDLRVGVNASSPNDGRDMAGEWCVGVSCRWLVGH